MRPMQTLKNKSTSWRTLWLRVPNVFPGLGFISQLITISKYSSRESDAFFLASKGTRHIYGAQAYMKAKYPHIINEKE